MGKTYDEIQIGDRASFEKTLTETDVYLYAGITGDLNPAHVNQRVSEAGHFKGRIVHGMLSASLFSTVLGTLLPGPGSIYVSQEVNFLAPVFFGDTLQATLEVTEKLGKGRVKLNGVCTNQKGETIITGTSIVIAPKEAP